MRFPRCRFQISAGLLACLLAFGAAAGPVDRERDALLEKLEELAHQNRELLRRVERLERAAGGVPTPPPVSAAAPAPPALASRQLGPARLQLLDISLDVLASAGWSSADNAALLGLQGGGHDPRQRGFNLQQAELGLRGAVDPYLSAESYLVYFLDPEGESRFEIEEAFVTTQMLPFGLEQHGLQLEVGHFFTEAGRMNPAHPHSWDWQDQPIVNSRLFGADGMRAPGLRLGWLLPLPWFAELHLGVQNAAGETMASFRASDEVFQERPIGGRPFADAGVRDPGDLVYLARLVNGADLSDEWSFQWGGTGLFGPNATGGAGTTAIAGTDLVVKWLPLDADRGAPSLTWQTEFFARWYRAAGFFGCPGLAGGEACEAADAVALAGALLRDHGFYTQLLWGVRRGWEAGLRLEYAGGRGRNVAFDEDLGAFVPASRNADPFRDDRLRLSPLLIFRLSEFARLRLQYNWDRVEHLQMRNVHTGWVGLEFLFGSHPAHGY